MKARLIVLAAALVMLAFWGTQIGAQNDESEKLALRDFPAPFVREGGKAQVAIIADEADLPTAQRLVEAFGQWTSDTIEIISDREDYPWWETNIIVVGGPGENELARYLNGEEDLPMPFVPTAPADGRLRYGISWRFKLWEEPGSGTLQLFFHGYSEEGELCYVLLIAGVDPQGTARAAEALLAKAPEMLGQAAFVTDGRIEVLVDPEVDLHVPVRCVDAPVDYAFHDGLLRVEFWPTPFPDGMALALIHNIYLWGKAWEGGCLGGFPSGYLMGDLPVHIQMEGLRRFLEWVGVEGFSLPELTIESVDLASGVAQVKISYPDGGEDRFRLPPQASYERLILRGETEDYGIGGELYAITFTIELKLRNLGLGRAVWGQRGDRFFPQGFVALALEVPIYSSHIKELEWGLESMKEV